jgi:hypothetical protein
VFYFRIEKLAAKRGCTPAQLALAWVLNQGDDVVPIPGESVCFFIYGVQFCNLSYRFFVSVSNFTGYALLIFSSNFPRYLKDQKSR